MFDIKKYLILIMNVISYIKDVCIYVFSRTILHCETEYDTTKRKQI